jgi:hypothetical protein
MLVQGEGFLTCATKPETAFTLARVIRESSEAEVLGQMFLEFFRASLFGDAPACAGPRDCELAVAALLRRDISCPSSAAGNLLSAALDGVWQFFPFTKDPNPQRPNEWRSAGFSPLEPKVRKGRL